MYCPFCGAESTQGLNFCKRCGANISPAAYQRIQTTDRSGRRGLGAVWALVVALITVVSGGLGISLGIAGGLVANGVGAHDGPIVIAVCGSTIVLAVSLILLALLWRVIGAATASQQNPIQGRQSELMNAVPEPVQIPAHNAASVTEHTTRTFEPPKYSESGRH